MGYVLSRNSVIRNKKQLEQLLEHQTNLLFRVKNPAKLAYKIREAIRASQEFEEFKHFSELSRMYIFRETPRGLLAVFQEEDDSPVKVETVEEFLAGLSTKTSPLQPEQPPEPPKKRTVTEASSLIDILAIAVQFHSDFELFFPNVELPEQEKLQLYNWTQDKPGVAWDFIDHGEGGVTLTKQEVSDDIIWKPPVRENGSEYPL